MDRYIYICRSPSMQIDVFMNCLLHLQIDDEFIAQAAIKIKVTQSSETRQAALIVIDDCETRHVAEGRLNCPVDPTDRTFAWQMMIYALTVSLFTLSPSFSLSGNTIAQSELFTTIQNQSKAEQSRATQLPKPIALQHKFLGYWVIKFSI